MQSSLQEENKGESSQDDLHYKFFLCKLNEVKSSPLLKDLSNPDNDPLVYSVLNASELVLATQTEDKEPYKELMKKIDTMKEIVGKRVCIRDTNVTVKDFYNKKWKDSDIISLEKESFIGSNGEVFNYGARALALMADLDFMIAITRIRTAAYIKGAFNIRASWKYYEKLEALCEKAATLKANPGSSFLDDKIFMSYVLFGCGVFHFFISLVPNGFKWILKGFGFAPDRIKGFKEIIACGELNAGMGYLCKAIHIALTGFFYEDRDKAEKLYQKYVAVHPQASALHIIAGVILRVNGQVEGAEEKFKLAKEFSADYIGLCYTCDHEVAWCKILQNDFEGARVYYENFLANQKSKGQFSWAYYQLGWCLWCVGKKEQAMEAFAKVKEFKKKHYAFDEYAARRATDFIKNGGISPQQVLLQRAFHTRRCNDTEATSQLLAEFERDFLLKSNADDQAYYYYLMGKNYRFIQDFDKARDEFNQVINLSKNIKNEKFLVPHAKYKILLMDIDQGKISKADGLQRIKEIEKYTSYDFEKPLRRRLMKVKDGWEVTEELNLEDE